MYIHKRKKNQSNSSPFVTGTRLETSTTLQTAVVVGIEVLIAACCPPEANVTKLFSLLLIL
jgi:hypothetical protein